MYDTVCRALCRSIGEADYFSGSVADPDGAWRLTVTVLVSRRAGSMQGFGRPAGQQILQAPQPENRSVPEAALPWQVDAASGDGNLHACGVEGGIVDLVPVWWEFHTWNGAEEVLNDFSFSRMNERLCRCTPAAA